MKKFGFGKKSDGGGGDDDGNRNALFGSRKNKPPADPSSNPYAQQPAGGDPYAQAPKQTPYQQARQQVAAAPAGGLPNGPGPNRTGYGAPPPNNGGYGAPPAVNRDPAPNGGGYGAEKYGSGGGYGNNRYEPPPPSYRSEAGSIRPGGYGGLGRSNSNDTMNTEVGRNELFGGAQDRYAERAAQPPPNGRAGGGYGADSGTPGGSGAGGYGEDRQLTAEEEEEEDVANTKDQIRFMKREDVSTTRNALRIAQQAEETGRATLARLGAQGERIHNTEKNLDIASSHNHVAAEKAKELKTLNRSMFAVHVSNPFTASSRRAGRDDEIIAKHQADRFERDETRRAQFGSQQRMESAFKELQPGDVGYRPPQKTNLKERSKYQFEADSEDEEMENEIDSNIDALGHAAGRLNLLARATGKEVDEQNKHIDRIIVKSDRVDDQIAMNRARLDRFK